MISTTNKQHHINGGKKRWLISVYVQIVVESECIKLELISAVVDLLTCVIFITDIMKVTVMVVTTWQARRTRFGKISIVLGLSLKHHGQARKPALN